RGSDRSSSPTAVRHPTRLETPATICCSGAACLSDPRGAGALFPNEPRGSSCSPRALAVLAFEADAQPIAEDGVGVLSIVVPTAGKGRTGSSARRVHGHRGARLREPPR